MVKKRRPKNVINENYFDKLIGEGVNDIWYILGAFYSGYKKPRANEFVFRSHSKDLVEIVKNKIADSNSIFESKTSGCKYYNLVIGNAKHLTSKLGDLGLDVEKKYRKFPKNIPKKYISDFIRGFIDAHGSIYNDKDNQFSNLNIRYNKQFLTDLNRILVKYADVKHKKPIGDVIRYNHENIEKIYNFIYYDDCLHLPSMKKAYFSDKSIFVSNKRETVTKKIAQIKKLLLQGKQIKEFYEDLCFSHDNAISRLFKQEVGVTIREYIKEPNKY